MPLHGLHPDFRGRGESGAAERRDGMRSDPSEYEIVSPGSLEKAVSLMAESSNAWMPIAGGTDLMVQYAAGKLSARKLINIGNLQELRRIQAFPHEIQVGAGSTYTDLRENTIVKREFPLLATAASWVGGIANQNRGTLGGNIVNASPAADSLPSLLAYDAELVLISIRGERRVRYRDFHTGYKKTKLAPDELIRFVCLPRGLSGYLSYTRKAGTRNAQAISKVCIAALARIDNGAIADARIALGSVAPVPMRLTETERLLNGRIVDPALVAQAREKAQEEIKPIDDIRSTAKYRAAVAGNLVAEFLARLGGHRHGEQLGGDAGS
jgi:CO/xanthine dehydrogenase FAD-binding subunit